MTTYDLIERLNTTFREIEQALLTLTGQLQDCRLLAARVFSLPEVAKGAEHDPLNTIEVTQHVGKAALEMTTRALALELAPHVRVNAIAPGAILWPEQGKSEAAKQKLMERTPMARTGTPHEIAAAVRWLLDEAGYVTGQTLRLDGGRGLT